jgi:hypothetical protein
MWIRYQDYSWDRFRNFANDDSLWIEEIGGKREVRVSSRTGYAVTLFTGSEEECKQVVNGLFYALVRGDKVHRISPTNQPEEESNGDSRQVSKQFSFIEYLQRYIFGSRGCS